MPLMVPDLTDEVLDTFRSRAEARFYRAARRQLGNDLVVVHSVPFILTRSIGPPRDGETDFVIFDPKYGFTVVEIKGGGVTCDKAVNKWYSIDASSVRHEIKDPFRQATNEKYAILDQIRRSWPLRAVPAGRLLIGHAVFLPDITRIQAAAFTQYRPEILGTREDLENLDRWYKNVVSFWSGAEPDFNPLGSVGMKCVEDLYCRAIEIDIPLSARLNNEDMQRIHLTAQQSAALRLLARRNRVAICGGAGTGKTILAVERAKEIARAGHRTLLLCYNRALADHLSGAIGNCDDLLACSFHQLCEMQVRQVLTERAIDLYAEAKSTYPNENEYDVQMPYALARSTEYSSDRFEAIVVDEGQDFGEEYWMPVELLLTGRDTDILCIFFDQNQAIYRKVQSFPIVGEPYPLTQNCRNTRPIHEAAYVYFRGDATQPPPIEGAPIRRVIASGVDAQARRIHAELVRLLVDEELSPNQIVILLLGYPKKDYYQALSALPLPRGIVWSQERHHIDDSILVDTVKRFKGLEAPVLFLWAGLAPTYGNDELLYVGLSRAKSRLYVVGTDVVVTSILKKATV